MNRTLFIAPAMGALWGLIVAATEISVLPVEAMPLRDQGSVAFGLALVWVTCGVLLGFGLGAFAARLAARLLIPIAFAALYLANVVQASITRWLSTLGEGAARMFGRAPEHGAIMVHGLWVCIFFGGLALSAYLLRRRADRTRAFIARSMIALRESETALAAAQARALRSQFDPETLAGYVSAVRERYRLDLAHGDLLLERLTDYLRAAMPAVRRGERDPASAREMNRCLKALDAGLANTQLENTTHERY